MKLSDVNRLVLTEEILTFEVTCTNYSCLFNKLDDSVNFNLITALVVQLVDLNQ